MFNHKDWLNEQIVELDDMTVDDFAAAKPGIDKTMKQIKEDIDVWANTKKKVTTALTQL